jgi:hypothetical protein
MTTAGKNTYKMLSPFIKGIPAPGFLSGLFQAPAANFHNQKKVHIDKSIEAEEVAFPVDDVTSNYHMNNSKDRDEVEVAPPVYKEGEAVSIDDLYDRQTGMSPYESNDFQRNGVALALVAGERLQRKIRRGLEIQASQVLTTGALSLVDDTGAVKFALDYNMDTDLFPTVSVPWSTTASADPIGDMYSLCGVMRDGGNDATWSIMAGESFEAAMAITSFKERFTAVNANVGALNPMSNPGTRGGNLRGNLQVGDSTNTPIPGL